MAEDTAYKGALDQARALPHGAYNALAVTNNPKKQALDLLTTDPINLLKDELYKKNTPDVFDMKTEWNAIVLKDITEFNIMNNPLTIALNTILKIEKEDKVKFVGYIPEIHGCLILPTNPDDVLAMSQFPIFEGAAALGTVKIGDIVRVTFDNLNNLSGPKYIGPISGKGSIVGLNASGNPNSANSFNNSPRARRTSVPQLEDLNNDPSRVGHAVGKGTDKEGIWPKNLTLVQMMKGKIPNDLYTRAQSRGFSTDLVPVPSIEVDQHLNVYLSVAVAEVIEQYWRQQFPDASVRIISNVRNGGERDPNNSHGIGAAIDFVVHQGGTTIPVLQTWAALTRLAKAGRIPLGGKGIYLNVASNGIKGTKPEEAGEASPGQRQHSSHLPQGGSAGIHYDWRDSFGNQRGPDGTGGKATKWIAVDLDGDGKDEYELGQPNTELNTDARYVLTYLREKLPTVLRYWWAEGSTDTTLPEVTDKVFNLLQVLEIEE